MKKLLTLITLIYSCGILAGTIVFPLPSTAYKYTSHGTLAPIFPQPDSAGTVQAAERQKMHPAHVPLRIPVGFEFGVAPLHYSVSCSGCTTQPTIGADLPDDWQTNGPQNYGVLMLDDPAPIGNVTFTVTATDQTGATAQSIFTTNLVDKNATTPPRVIVMNCGGSGTNAFAGAYGAGSSSNTGTYSSPYGGDTTSLRNVFGSSSTSSVCTSGGHASCQVMFINCGSSYVLPDQTDQSHKTSLDNTKRPVVYWALPDNAATPNKATLDFSNTTIYYGNESGMFWGDLTFNSGDATVGNYQNILVSDGQDRLTLFNVNLTNPVNGTDTTANPTMVFGSNSASTTDSTFDHFIYFYDVHEVGRPAGVGDNSTALFIWYGAEHMLVEFSGVPGTSATASMRWKDTNIYTTSRYNYSDTGNTNFYPVDLYMQSQNGGPNGFNEFVYGRFKSTSVAAMRINTENFSTAGPVWVSRSSLIGANGGGTAQGLDIRSTNSGTGPYISENNAIQAPSPVITAISNATNPGNECQGVSGILNTSTFDLVGTCASTWLGQRGYKIYNPGGSPSVIFNNHSSHERYQLGKRHAQ